MENLPIKFFAKREDDTKFVEGGGNGDNPKFVLSGEKLAERAAFLKDQVSNLENKIKTRIESSDVPSVIKIRIIDEAKAKSHKKKVRKLFEYNRRNNIIGLIDDNEILVKVDSCDYYDEIAHRLNNTNNYAYQISAINDFALYEPIRKLKEGKTDYKIKLHNYQSNQVNDYVCNNLESNLKKMCIEFGFAFYNSFEKIYRLINVDRESINGFLESDSLNGLFSIEPMPKYTISLDSLNVSDEFITSYPEKDVDYTTVGILDSGIEGIPQLTPWIVKENYTAYPEKSKDTSHGTFIAGIVVYGDLLEGIRMTDTNRMKVLDACVFPDVSLEGISEVELISNITDAIRMYHRSVKIWTLSISRKIEIKDDSFSDFAKALDYLQDTYDVLIVKSAGNTKNFMKSKENGRIYEGADSVRSITIGSVAHKSNSESLVNMNDISPFSRIGRGPASIIKPELVHYGGNVGKNKSGYYPLGVNSFSNTGELSSAIGTSYSTPRVAGLISDLDNRLDEEFNPLLLKALLIHSANYPKESIVDEANRNRFMGFGKPKTASEILYNKQSSSTLILKDELYKGDFIDIFNFPMPDCLKKDGYYSGNVTITLVYSPILDGSQGSEYCQSDIDIKFGTYQDIKTRDISKNNIRNKFGRDNAKNILLPGFLSKRKLKKNESEFKLLEHTLIYYRDKYYPVKKYSFSLSDATEANRLQYLDENMKWFIYLRGYFRDHVEAQSELTGEVLSQEFCMVVTITDEDDSKDVYDGVIQKLNEYNFVSSNIKIKSEVKITI